MLVPAALNAKALGSLQEAGVLPPILEGLARSRPRGAGKSRASLQRRLSGVPEPKWPQIVLDMVRDHVASVRGLDSGEAVRADLAFKEMGFDSLSAVELRNSLARATDIRLPATLVFDYPTPAAVAEHLLGHLDRSGRSGPAIEDEFDRIEQLLHEVATDEQNRNRVEARVRAFNARVQNLLLNPDAAGNGASDDDLASASDDEIFELIDKEIGTP